MTLQERTDFVNELVGSIKTTLLTKVGQTPDEWDGHELRQWIVDTFADLAIANKMTGKRMKEYRNEVLIRNL